MIVSAGLSALLMNDIICLAFTPVLCYSLQRAGLNPIPFLIALAISSNIGSATTIIGNPQHMLIGQVGKLHFGAFLQWCLPPSVISLLLAYIPRDLTALSVAGILLCSRKLRTARVLGLVDWNLITLFIGLFVLIRGFETTHMAEQWMERLAAWRLDFKKLSCAECA